MNKLSSVYWGRIEKEAYISDNFHTSVKSGNLRAIRIMASDSMLVDPTMAEHDSLISAAKEVPGLFEAHDGGELLGDKALWNDDYMNKQMVQCKGCNFSPERVEHLKEVVRHLRPQDVKDAPKAAHAPGFIAVPKASPSSGFAAAIKGHPRTALAVAGIAGTGAIAYGLHKRKSTTQEKAALYDEYLEKGAAVVMPFLGGAIAGGIGTYQAVKAVDNIAGHFSSPEVKAKRQELADLKSLRNKAWSAGWDTGDLAEKIDMTPEELAMMWSDSDIGKTASLTFPALGAGVLLGGAVGGAAATERWRNRREPRLTENLTEVAKTSPEDEFAGAAIDRAISRGAASAGLKGGDYDDESVGYLDTSGLRGVQLNHIHDSAKRAWGDAMRAKQEEFGGDLDLAMENFYIDGVGADPFKMYRDNFANNIAVHKKAALYDAYVAGIEKDTL